MASSSLSFLLFTLFFASIKAAYTPIILPVKKDITTRQYHTTINLGKPSYTLDAIIDIGGPLLWFNGEASKNKSSTYTAIECGTSECNDLADGFEDGNSCHACQDAPQLGCYKNACAVSAYNPIKPSWTLGDLWRDNIAFGAKQVVPNFLFSCVPKVFLEGLAPSAQGILGLGWIRTAMLSQISSTFNVPPRFALCAPSSSKRSGSIVFAANSYSMTPYPSNARELLNWTYLSFDDNNLKEPSDYIIGVGSIKINGKPVPYRYSSGKASISTRTPYTALKSDIYKAVVRDFVKSAEIKRIVKVAPVAPFGACFDAKTIRNTRTGPDVPLIDLVLAPYRFQEAVWTIYGANSMVRVKKDVMCLAFVDGGSKAKIGIVIGGHQLEDNLLEFDLGDSRLGFSSTLLLHNTKCSHLTSA